MLRLTDVRSVTVCMCECFPRPQQVKRNAGVSWNTPNVCSITFPEMRQITFTFSSWDTDTIGFMTEGYDSIRWVFHIEARIFKWYFGTESIGLFSAVTVQDYG